MRPVEDRHRLGRDECATRLRGTRSTDRDVAALAEALTQFAEEGGQAAGVARYTENYRALVDGMAEFGFVAYLAPEIQSPIIVTFHAPADPRYRFPEFYEAVKERGFILYPGKLTEVPTFRVGCIGAIGVGEMRQAILAIADAMRSLGIQSGRPAI